MIQFVGRVEPVNLCCVVVLQFLISFVCGEAFFSKGGKPSRMGGLLSIIYAKYILINIHTHSTT